MTRWLSVKSEGTREVVLAMNANVDGDTTALYLSRVLAPCITSKRLASGIPLGENWSISTVGLSLELR